MLLDPDTRRKNGKEDRKSILGEFDDENDLSITYTNTVIVLKTENLIVEAKIISQNDISGEVEEFAQTFNPTDISNREDNDDDLLPLNETTKQFIFKLLKIFIDNFYMKIHHRQEELEREDNQNIKIAEYENELRLLKEWNGFILASMNKQNIMDTYENAVVTIEKYLICEIAKYHNIADINIYFTPDMTSLMKVHNGKEIIHDELDPEISEKLRDSLDIDEQSENGTVYTTNNTNLVNENDHYFMIKADKTVPYSINFLIKIENEEEQEGMIITTTLQVLSDVFLQTLSHFLNLYYKESFGMPHTQVYQTLMERKKETLRMLGATKAL